MQLAEEEAKQKSPAPPQFLETPEGRRLAYQKLTGCSPGVVFIHGLKSTMNGHKALALENFCRRRGTSFVKFELSGHGDSSQEFKDCNITMWLEDLNAILSSLTEGPQVLVGSSIGGWLMFLYTMRNPDRITGLLGVSTAPDFTQALWKSLDKATKSEVRKKGVYHLKSPYSDEPYDISLELIQDGDKYSVLDMPGVEFVKCPVWLFHGEMDTEVPPSTALKLVQRLQCPVELKTIHDGEHRLSRPEDIQLILEGLDKLLSPPQEKSEASGADSSEQDD